MKKIFLVAPYQVDTNYSKKKNILKELCSKYNLELQIAEDKKSGISMSARETVDLLKACSFAIADMSFERPSCYYELGFLEALNKKVYLLSKLGTILHQTLSLHTLLEYADLNEYHSAIERFFIKEAILRNMHIEIL